MATGTWVCSFNTKTQTLDKNLVKGEWLLLSPQDTQQTHCNHVFGILYHRQQIRNNFKLSCQQLFVCHCNINLQQSQGLKTKGERAVRYSAGSYIRRKYVIFSCKLLFFFFFTDPPTTIFCMTPKLVWLLILFTHSVNFYIINHSDMKSIKMWLL